MFLIVLQMVIDEMTEDKKVICEIEDCGWTGLLSETIPIGKIEIYKNNEEPKPNSRPLCPQCLIGTLKAIGVAKADNCIMG